MRKIRVFWDNFFFPLFFNFFLQILIFLFMSLRYDPKNPSILGQLFFPKFFKFLFSYSIQIARKMNHVFTNS